MSLQTMPDKGEWTVRVELRRSARSGVDRWTWIYVFFKNGTVTWTDLSNGMHGQGTWKIEKSKLIIRWAKSTTWEEWDLPLSTRDETGKAHMQAGTFDLHATANNFLDPDEKAKFLEKCTVALNKVQVAQLKFSAWLSGISVAYGDAYDAHNKVIDDIAALQKLVNDMLLDAALRFLTGGTAGAIGGAMRAAAVSDFMVDGIKDLTKYSLRAPLLAAGRAQTKITAMPASPHKWQNLVNERVSTEMSEVSNNMLRWRLAVEPDLTTFDANFDPADVVQKALTIKTSVDTLSLMTLKEVDKEPLQRDSEKGFLVKWIELGAVSNVPMSRDIARDKLRAYGVRLGLKEIDDLLNKYAPAFRPMFPPGSLTP
jgi:hypothetical protein